MMLNTYPRDTRFHQSVDQSSMNCWVKFIYTYFPIVTWLPKYSWHYLQCDVIAGVTVGLMVLPQGLAYASIARLPNNYGLYSSFLGGFVYCVFGTAKDITIGPTAILSLMVQTYSIPHCGDLAVLFSFYVGIILLFMGIFRLGFLVRFVSVPVISAFSSAAAITIACGQLKDLLGIEHLHRDFIGNLHDVFSKAGDWNFYDLGYGIVCIIILILMRLLSKLTWDERMHIVKIYFYKCLWLCGIARNALIVFISCIIIYVLDFKKLNEFTVIDDVKSGLPDIKPPEFTDIRCGNTTLDFVDTLSQFNSGLLVVPMLAFIEAIAIGKAFSRVNGYKVQPTQELIAIGLANTLNSFVSGYPVTGSFSRTAVNSQSGVKTPLAGIFTGCIVMLAIQFLTKMFQYIPKACLGAIIISALIMMIDIKIIRSMWRVKKIDLFPYTVTFFGCFYSLDVGLLLGISCSLVIVLYPILVPFIDIETKDVCVIRIKDNLYYTGIEHVINKVENIIDQSNPPIVILLDMIGVNIIDYTVAIEIHELLKQMETRRPTTELLVTNVSFGVKRVLIMAGLHHIITSPENVSERFEDSHRLLYD